jgi:L-glyceraldehyde 3-phosphate reductase
MSEGNRYERMSYRRLGDSGLYLPRLSLGLWHNFGGVDSYDTAKNLLLFAFDNGITHFDLANNYGPPPGSAERTLGRVLKSDLSAHRAELVISTKAGYRMWPGPYGDGGSRKYLVESLDQSLERMGIDHVDIFYHHRPDKETPLEETMNALAFIVQSGRALYVGLSNYDAQQTHQAATILRRLGTPFIAHQPSYNIFRRDLEGALEQALTRHGLGAVVFSPLAQGLLTNRYETGIPEDSRIAKEHGFLQPEDLTARQTQIQQLAALARSRGQTLAQMSLAWTLRRPAVCSAVVGASRREQLADNLGALKHLDFSSDEETMIDQIAPKP